MMGWLRRRAERRRFEELWKPDYDILAQYNGEVARGIEHEPSWRVQMEEIQRDYDRNFRPYFDLEEE